MSAGWRNKWRNVPSWFCFSTLSCAPHDITESSSNFPFKTFISMRSGRGSQFRVIILFIIETGQPWAWIWGNTNRIRTISLKLDCPRLTKLYGHSAFEFFIRTVIQWGCGDYVLRLWMDPLGLNSDLITYQLCVFDPFT